MDRFLLGFKLLFHVNLGDGSKCREAKLKTYMTSGHEVSKTEQISTYMFYDSMLYIRYMSFMLRNKTRTKVRYTLGRLKDEQTKDQNRIRIKPKPPSNQLDTYEYIDLVTPS